MASTLRAVSGGAGWGGRRFLPFRPPVSLRRANPARVFVWVALLLASAFPLPLDAHAAKKGVVRTLDSRSPDEQPLPTDIRRGLNIDERVLSCFTGEQGTVRFKERWFASTRINLNGDRYPDWIVHSTQPCLGGDGGVRWWVFRTIAREHQLILAANAARLDVLRERAGGFRVLVADRVRYRYSVVDAEYVAEAAKPTTGETGSVEGQWQPESKALEGLGALTLSGTTLRWSICKNARLNAEISGAEGQGRVLAVEGSPGCHLSGHTVRQLRIRVREGGCKAELSLYADAQAANRDEPLAWGIISRKPCER